MNTSDKAMEQRARELYLEAARRIDPTTAGRLRAARREALASTTRPAHRPHHVARWLVPAGAFAAVALAALMLWPSAPRPASMPGTPTAATATANGSTAEPDTMLPPDPEQADPNLYQNLDFYGWLAANNNSQPQTR